MVVRYMAQRRLLNYTRYMMPNYDLTDFHKVYITVLDMFAKGDIRRVIVSMPPQHGKTLEAGQMLPSFLLGQNPDFKIVIGSYSADQSKNLNIAVQKIINSEAYKAVFPNTFLNTQRVRLDNVYRCNSEISEPVGHTGFLRAVGRNGALTGKSVDISILDDVYKDFAEASSPLIRELAWKWYTTVVRTRLHNDSQELIVFTRWHEDDLIGRLQKSGEKIVLLKEWKDLENLDPKTWVHINFPALKVGPPTEIDPRIEGEALWESKHSRAKLLESRSLDPVQFEALYQGDPGSAESKLYGEFKTYVDKNDWGTLIRKGCCVDVADKGTDFLCSITYDVYKSPNTIYNEAKHRFEPILFALVTDVVFTDEGTEITIVSVPMQINSNGTQRVWIESNNGGEQYASQITKRVRAEVVPKFTRGNKESRIISNSSGVMGSIVFPVGWKDKWPKFANNVSGFMRSFKANAHDDGPDCLTMIYEREIASGDVRPYSASHRRKGIRRAN